MWMTKHRVKLTRAPFGMRVKRGVVLLSPFAATLLLTAAIFLLPATSNHLPAQASAAGASVSQTYISYDFSAEHGAVKR